jgi:MFS family permease
MLAAVIASISVVGLSLGLSIPLVSLALERDQVDSTLIGVMAAMPAIGILMFSPLIPWVVGRFGAIGTLYGSIAVSGSAVIALPFLDDYGIWLVLRFVLGAADGALFTVSETWINQIARESNRGRLVALYATVLSLCLSLGPVLILVTGSEGAVPFLVAGAILYLAGIPLAWARGRAPRIGGAGAFGVFAFFRVAPTLCAAVLLFAFLDGAAIGLLPLFGVRHGYEEAVAALMITALVGGNIALQIPIGWVADRMDREKLLFLCGCGVLIGAAVLPLAVQESGVVWPVLILLGAAGGGVYTLALVIVGQRFRGMDLVTANAAIGVLWGVGNLAGPLAGGVGIALWDPNGLPITITLAAALFLGLFAWRRSVSFEV